MKQFFICLFMMYPLLATGKIQVVATGPDLGALVQEVGGDQVGLTTLARGSQNLHFLETKPSYMVQVRKADLVVANGLGLEVAWLPQVIRGARNPKVRPGEKGYLELGHSIEAIEIPTGTISRSHGDVHPEGNPHWTLDPVRMGEAALALAQHLGEMKPDQAEVFTGRAEAFQKRLLEQVQKWQQRLQQAGITKVVTYHRTLNYFLTRFGIEPAAYLEPKPGIPPTAQHILQVIRSVREQHIPLILIENYYDTKVAERVSQEVEQVEIRSVSVAVGGQPGLNTLEDLYEHLVQALEGAK